METTNTLGLKYDRPEFTEEFVTSLRRQYGPSVGGAFPNPQANLIYSLLDIREELLEENKGLAQEIDDHKTAYQSAPPNEASKNPKPDPAMQPGSGPQQSPNTK